MDIPRISTGALIGGAVALGTVAAVGAVAIAKSRKRKNKKRKASTHKTLRSTSSRSRKRGRKLKFGSKAWRKKYIKHGRNKHRQRKPHTAGKRSDTSHRRIRYTKNNQPYIILRNGRARFISKKSVSSSRKRKGGKY
jgi:hypothetical protein